MQNVYPGTDPKQKVENLKEGSFDGSEVYFGSDVKEIKDLKVQKGIKQEV